MISLQPWQLAQWHCGLCQMHIAVPATWAVADMGSHAVNKGAPGPSEYRAVRDTGPAAPLQPFTSQGGSDQAKLNRPTSQKRRLSKMSSGDRGEGLDSDPLLEE